MIGLQPSTKLPNENSNLLSSIQNFLSRTCFIKNVYFCYIINSMAEKNNAVLCTQIQAGFWDFEYQPPYFENDEFNLASIFPIFANV